MKRASEPGFLPPLRLAAAAAFLFLCLPACGGASPPALSPTSTQPIRPDTGSKAETAPAATATAAPTETAAPTATGMPDGLNSAGPYAVFSGEQGIWIANPDGGFAAKISDVGLEDRPLEDALSPAGGFLAQITVDKTGLDLIRISIPGGEKKTIARLIDITAADLRRNAITLKAFAYYAIHDLPSLAWQPGSGGVLAYIGASDAGEKPTADLFTYDTAWDKIRHVETDGAQSIRPIWSPDGQYLLYFGVNWLPPYGPVWVTFDPMVSFSAVHVADGRILPQPELAGTYENFIGWRDATHYAVYGSNKQCAVRDINEVDVETGAAAAPLVTGCFNTRPAWSPADHTILFSADAGCDCGLEEGVYRLSPGETQPVRLTGRKAYDLQWLPESGLFSAYPLGLFASDGTARFEPPAGGGSYLPAVSSTGRQAWEIVGDYVSRVVVLQPDGTWRTVLEETEGNIAALLWDRASGETLIISLVSGELYAASAPDFTPRLMSSLAPGMSQAAWIS
jgi:hypothetical protein